MTKIQMDLDAEENKIVELYKINNNFNTKKETIKKMIRFFKAEIVPQKLNKKDYFEIE